MAQAANAQLNYVTRSLREQADIKLVPIKEWKCWRKAG